VLAEIVDAADVRMIERRSGSRFPLEAIDSRGVVREIRREELERDLASQAEVLGAINHAHAAPAD
jgi:hypothetical protein